MMLIKRREVPGKDCNQTEALNDKQYCTARCKNPSEIIDADEVQAEALCVRARAQAEVIIA